MLARKKKEYNEMIGLYKENKLQKNSIMISNDQIWNLHHIRSSK